MNKSSLAITNNHSLSQRKNKQKKRRERRVSNMLLIVYQHTKTITEAIVK